MNDSVLSSLLKKDQIAAVIHAQSGVCWSGWGTTTAGMLHAPSLHGDERAMGTFLCERARHIYVLEPTEFAGADDAAELLKLQQLAMTQVALEDVPATWLRTGWGAHSPDAVIQAGAVIEGPVLVGPGCFVSAGAWVGSGTVLTQDVVISNGARIGNSLVFPGTFVGKGLELNEAVVNGGSVQHLRYGVRTVLPRSDGLLFDLQSTGAVRTSWHSRMIAIALCVLFFPWLAIDTMMRRIRGLPLRWNACLVALGRDFDTGEVKLQTLRCRRSSGQDLGQWISHYGEWMDVAAGCRSWFGVRPRSQSEWYSLGRDWQLILANAPIGCMYAPAWSEENGESLESCAAADVFYAVNQSFFARLRIARISIKYTLFMHRRISSMSTTDAKVA